MTESLRNGKANASAWAGPREVYDFVGLPPEAVAP